MNPFDPFADRKRSERCLELFLASSPRSWQKDQKIHPYCGGEQSGRAQSWRNCNTFHFGFGDDKIIARRNNSHNGRQWRADIIGSCIMTVTSCHCAAEARFDTCGWRVFGKFRLFWRDIKQLLSRVRNHKDKFSLCADTVSTIIKINI